MPQSIIDYLYIYHLWSDFNLLIVEILDSREKSVMNSIFYPFDSLGFWKKRTKEDLK